MRLERHHVFATVLFLQEFIYHLEELGWMVHGASMGTRDPTPERLYKLQVLKERLQLSLGVCTPGNLRSRTGVFRGWSCWASPPHQVGAEDSF